MLLLAPIGLELLRQALGARWSAHHRLFYLPPSREPRRGRSCVVLLATVLAVATPIKIWNNARIEHRLQEQEKLLLAAKIEALANQINPHFLFNTLTSISSLIRTQPETARMLIIKLSGLLRRLMRSTDHFVTLREELESIDEYLDIEVGPLRAAAARRQSRSAPDTLDVDRAEHDPAAARRELDQARPLAQGRRRPHHDHDARCATDARVIEVHDDGVGHDGGAARAGVRRRHRPEQRQRAAAHDLRRGLSAEADERSRARARCAQRRDSRAGAFPSGSRRSMDDCCAPCSSTTSSWRATSSATCSDRSAASK